MPLLIPLILIALGATGCALSTKEEDAPDGGTGPDGGNDNVPDGGVADAGTPDAGVPVTYLAPTKYKEVDVSGGLQSLIGGVQAGGAHQGVFAATADQIRFVGDDGVVVDKVQLPTKPANYRSYIRLSNGTFVSTYQSQKSQYFPGQDGKAHGLVFSDESGNHVNFDAYNHSYVYSDGSPSDGPLTQPVSPLQVGNKFYALSANGTTEGDTVCFNRESVLLEFNNLTGNGAPLVHRLPGVYNANGLGVRNLYGTGNNNDPSAIPELIITGAGNVFCDPQAKGSIIIANGLTASITKFIEVEGGFGGNPGIDVSWSNAAFITGSNASYAPVAGILNGNTITPATLGASTTFIPGAVFYGASSDRYLYTGGEGTYSKTQTFYVDPENGAQMLDEVDSLSPVAPARFGINEDAYATGASGTKGFDTSTIYFWKLNTR